MFGIGDWPVTASSCAFALLFTACASPTTPTCNSTWNDSRLLIDCLGVDEFPLFPVLDARGLPVVPAAFTWKAPRAAEVVVCGAFVDIPTFEHGNLTNFDASSAFYDVRPFRADALREGTFELDTAQTKNVPCQRWKVAGVGCFAYSLTQIVAATPLRDVSFEGVDVGCARCSAGDRRLGSEVDGECLPYCTSDLACVRCETGLCRERAQ